MYKNININYLYFNIIMIKKRISRRIRNERRSRRLLNDSATQIYLIMENNKELENKKDNTN